MNSDPRTTQPLRDRIAARLADTELDDWSHFVSYAHAWGHKANCSKAEVKGPATCMMCVLEDSYEQADAWIDEASAIALREAAGICRSFAQVVLTETGSSGDEPEHDAAMSCANLIEQVAQIKERKPRPDRDDEP